MSMYNAMYKKENLFPYQTISKKPMNPINQNPKDVISEQEKGEATPAKEATNELKKNVFLGITAMKLARYLGPAHVSIPIMAMTNTVL